MPSSLIVESPRNRRRVLTSPWRARTASLRSPSRIIRRKPNTVARSEQRALQVPLLPRLPLGPPSLGSLLDVQRSAVLGPARAAPWLDARHPLPRPGPEHLQCLFDGVGRAPAHAADLGQLHLDVHPRSIADLEVGP